MSDWRSSRHEELGIGAGAVVSSVHRSPVAAAVLSFLWPGLGQAWIGARRRGLMFALPALLLLIPAAMVVVLFVANPFFTAGMAVQPEALVALMVVNAALLVYRCIAVVDAYRLAQRQAGVGGGEAEPTLASRHRPARVASLGAVVALVVVMAASHAVVGYVGYDTYDTVTTVFDPSDGTGDGTAASDTDPYGTPVPDDSGLILVLPSPGQTPADGTAGATSAPAGETPTAIPTPTPAQTPAPTPTPVPRPDWAADGRLNVLVIGGDAGPDRWSLRTDTMILVSVDVKTGRAAMFGIPRNLYNVPLPPRLANLFPCHCFPQMINELYSYADQRPAQFPGGKARGYLAVGAAIEALTGVDLDGIAVADLGGFVRLIDALGGLNITIRQPLYDSHYPLEDGTGWIEINFQPGKYHLNGRMALAYARSRHQDSDYQRMHRQQEVLLALRRQLKPACLVTKIPQLTKIARDSLWTNIEIKDLPGLLELASRVDPRTVARFAFDPPTYRESLQSDDVTRIRHVVRDVFTGPAPTPEPGSEPAADDSSC